MVSFTTTDIFVIVAFFALVIGVAVYSSRKLGDAADDYLLSGRKVGLLLFVLTTVSTWYGGILGVGEFTYRYGIVSWFTQGFPYYVFAIIFAFFFAKKIRAASLFTIPDKLTEVYGKKAGMFSAVLVFVLVSPAPYLLMTANLLQLIFGTGIIISLIFAFILSVSYLFKGGFKSNIYADAVQFFVMFAGFILILILSFKNYGGITFLENNLPEKHLTLTGGTSPAFILVWFLIALWTFADPGFHQRCYSAKTGNVAKWGIIISIFFWALFDFLTTSTGLYSRSVLPGIDQPVQSFPLLAEEVLGPGLKGIFYAALFATIMSTLNSFLFLSATTIGRDFIYRLVKIPVEMKLKPYTIIGLMISGILSILLAYFIPSVIEIWYTLGSLCIPAIILPVISAYYERLRVSKKIILLEMILAVVSSTIWYFIKDNFTDSILNTIEPMLVGVFFALVIHFTGLILERNSAKKK